ncbi:MAG TPA: hypothetical protein VEB42_12030 [Chitinophagaceae bacterium]|nr:hypothetical protein [Chitinophagaceae bacterium]
MAYVYNHLKTPKNTGSGVADFVLLAPVADFDEIKCPEAPFAAPGDEVTIKVPHVFKAGKGFIRILLAPEKNQYGAATIGDKGFQKFDHTYDIFVPGSYAEVHEFAKNIINTPLIALGKDAECAADIWYQLGCDCVYAYLTMDFTTGTTREGVKGYAGKITYQSSSVLLYKVEGGPAELA